MIADDETLEHLLDKTLGDHWRLDHGINKPIPEPSNDSSTPLPPPVALRYSTSMVFSNRRPSQQRSRPVSHLKMRISQPLNGVHEMNVDDTPTGALKKLEGGAKRPLAPKRIYREESDSTVDKERQEPAEKNIQTIRTSPIPLPLSTSKKGQRSNEAVIDVLREVETRLGDRVATLQALKLEVRKKLRKQGSAD